MTQRTQQIVVFGIIGILFVSIAGGTIAILAGAGNKNSAASSEQLKEIERQLAEQTEQKNQQDQIDDARENCGQLAPPENAKPLTVPKFDLPKTDVTKLATKDLKAGTGAEVKAGDCIVANYHGVLTDGTVFDSSYNRGGPSRFSLLRVIEGWQEGIPGMKVGGIRVLTIPSDKAYGETGNAPVIGPNADLVFVVEVKEIVK